MKFIFKKEQYQTDATKAVVDCFASQTKGKRKDIVSRDDIGYAREIFSNKPLEITDEDIFKNLQTVQRSILNH